MKNFQKVFESINWTNVAKEIVLATGIQTQLTFKQYREKYVEMVSENIIDQCGIFNRAIGECYLSFFSNGLNTDESAESKFWGVINLNYPGNGMAIATIWVKQNDEIVIKIDKPRSN